MLVWVAVSRYGPVTTAALRELVPVTDEQLTSTLEQLRADGRVRAHSEP